MVQKKLLKSQKNKDEPDIVEDTDKLSNNDTPKKDKKESYRVQQQ